MLKLSFYKHRSDEKFSLKWINELWLKSIISSYFKLKRPDKSSMQLNDKFNNLIFSKIGKCKNSKLFKFYPIDANKVLYFQLNIKPS